MDDTTGRFGSFLKGLRHDADLSVREAAKKAGISSAYLSQIETGKRGSRKGGAHFAPHPHILSKLANAYNVPANNLLVEARYLESELELLGFDEENELRRIFYFIVRDPSIRDIFPAQDMRAIVERYEALTGRRLVTWAGSDGPSNTKAKFQGLGTKDGILCSNIIPPMLTLDEVAEELRCDLATVHHLILSGKIDVREDSDGQLKILRGDVRMLKGFLVTLGLFEFNSKKQAETVTADELKRINALAKKNAKLAIRAELSPRWRKIFFEVPEDSKKYKKALKQGLVS
jgi:transcriptional regulator with XRE-family HTH domain